jgi:predicted dehydrogenase
MPDNGRMIFRTSRRAFLRAGPALLGAAAGAAGARSAGAPRYRAAIIGHTGHGDYGHGYDRVFAGLPEVTVVAVADPDPAGARRAAERSGAARRYEDYREMLERERPELVSVALRQPAEHPAIIRAAAACAKGIFCEKPLTETLPEADAVVAEVRARGIPVAVAHHRRYFADFSRARALIRRGYLGAVREAHLHGKQDRRAGGEDMIVLGTHDFDYLRWCFGDPRWCEATVTVAGRDATLADVRRGREPMRVLGDTIHAQFGFPGGLVARWSSVKTADDWNTRPLKRERWAFEMLGSRRILAWQSIREFGVLDSPFYLNPGRNPAWHPLPPAPDDPEAAGISMGRSLLEAVQTGGRPRCSAADGRWAIEMLTAVYQSHLTRRRVEFPLTDRRDPLG